MHFALVTNTLMREMNTLNDILFFIIELNAVEEFLEPECIFTSAQNVDITFRWVVSKQLVSF